MVFATTTLFKGITCPEGCNCRLTNCIYSHEAKLSESAKSLVLSADDPQQSSLPAHHASEPAAKRRKVTYDSLASKPPSRADIIRGKLASERLSRPQEKDNSHLHQKTPGMSSPPASLVKSVSPPPRTRIESVQRTERIDTLKSNEKAHFHALGPRMTLKADSLNPRLIPNDPAGHQKRSLYLRALHNEMLRLNKLMKESTVDFRSALICSDEELIAMSLDAEEKTAREQPTMYANIVKQQVAGYRKMKVEDWGSMVKNRLFSEPPQPAKKKEKPIETGLPQEEEHLILPHLVADQKPLAAFGYVPTPPSEHEAAEAAVAVRVSLNYEICDRCSARFQVFPERNEEGKLSSNGPCKYHPNRKVFPQRAKTDKETGAKEPYFPCCNEPMGTPGCTRDEEHVFKASGAARLAAVLPFEVTPENQSPSRDSHGNVVKAVTFDCEMGYTVYGMELIRLTAVSWPLGEELLDILVRPLGPVIDFNSRFSGVFPEHFKTAIPYDEWKKSTTARALSSGEPSLPIVESPQKARELLCSFLQPTTPLIGHAIDNDLNTVRLCHPTIIDTVMLFPHPRGLPMRFGLKMLTHRHLNRAIQQGGDRGHDSKEDALATGDLVRVKVGEKWKSLRASGWQIVDDCLVPPTSLERSVPYAGTDESQQSASPSPENAVSGHKRKRSVSSSEGVDVVDSNVAKATPEHVIV